MATCHGRSDNIADLLLSANGTDGTSTFSYIQSLIWTIYYDDGSTFSSLDGEPEDAPGYGVLAITQNRENTVLASQDFYLYREDYGCWIEVHIEGLIDHLVTAAHHVRAVKAGRTVPLSVYERVLRDVAVDEKRFYGDR